jgi:hypothetical protein
MEHTSSGVEVRQNVCIHCKLNQCPPNDPEGLCIDCNVTMSLALILMDMLELDRLTAYEVAQKQMEYLHNKSNQILELMRKHKCMH